MIERCIINQREALYVSWAKGKLTHCSRVWLHSVWHMPFLWNLQLNWETMKCCYQENIKMKSPEMSSQEAHLHSIVIINTFNQQSFTLMKEKPRKWMLFSVAIKINLNWAQMFSSKQDKDECKWENISIMIKLRKYIWSGNKFKCFVEHLCQECKRCGKYIHIYLFIIFLSRLFASS